MKESFEWICLMGRLKHALCLLFNVPVTFECQENYTGSSAMSA